MCVSDPYNADSASVPIILDRKYEDNLCVEMLNLFEELLPTRESHNRRMALVRKIERLLNAEWLSQNITVHLFGSSVNDLGTSHSDVDLCITTQWSGLRNIRTLAKLFRKCGMQQVACVPNAKVPIVRLFDPESRLACDINVNNTLAIQNTKMIKTYVAIDTRVRPFTMIIKNWAKQRLLNDAAHGGTLSTYTWTCIVINFLQMRQPPILPVLHQLKKDSSSELFFSNIEKLHGYGEANHESLGGLLFAFFRRYALEFDYDTQVVSARHGTYLTKAEKGWDTGRNVTSFCVEEPFNVTRNLGNSADIESVHGLRLEFKRALDLMLSGASLSTICAPYKRLTFAAIPDIQETLTENLSDNIPTEAATPPLSNPVKKKESKNTNMLNTNTTRSRCIENCFDCRQQNITDDVSGHPIVISPCEITQRPDTFEINHHLSQLSLAPFDPMYTPDPSYSPPYAPSTLHKPRHAHQFNCNCNSRRSPPAMRSSYDYQAKEWSVECILARYSQALPTHPQDMCRPSDSEGSSDSLSVNRVHKRKENLPRDTKAGGYQRHLSAHPPNGFNEWPSIIFSEQSPLSESKNNIDHRPRRWSTQKRRTSHAIEREHSSAKSSIHSELSDNPKGTSKLERVTSRSVEQSTGEILSNNAASNKTYVRRGRHH